MGKYTKADILRMVKEDDVEFIRLQFTDVFGIMKNVAITSSQLEKALDNECMFDGSSIDGFVRINESDMYLHPDYDTWTIFPWRKHQNAQTARLICSVYCADNKTPFLGDPRNVLQKVMDEAAEMGYSFNVGPECEFFLFKLDEEGNPFTAHTTNDVPLIVTNSHLELKEGGKLGDLAPTMLQLLGLAIPEEMDGTSLIK